MHSATLATKPRRSRWVLASTLFFSVFGGVATVLLLMSAWRGRATGEAKVLFREEEVRFEAGNNSLAGTLVRPTTPGLHPAVVCLTGAGATDRNGQGAIPALARHLAAQGFACLSWDRPGVGASSGDHELQSIADRADEAIAAMRFLRSQSGIQGDCIGGAGFGQGGVVAPLVAAESGAVAFVIEVSGCQLLGWEQERYRVEHELRADGFSNGAVAEALELTHHKLELLRNAGAYEEFDEAQKALLRRPWFAYLRYCERKGFNAARVLAECDPAPSWSKVSCPVLAIYGAKDTLGPVEASVIVIRQGLVKAGNQDLTVKVFPRADHLISVSDTGGRKEAAERARKRPDGLEFAPGYLDTVSHWLGARFGSRS